MAVVFLMKAGGNVFQHASITGVLVLSLQLLYVSIGIEGLLYGKGKVN